MLTVNLTVSAESTLNPLTNQMNSKRSAGSDSEIPFWTHEFGSDAGSFHFRFVFPA